MREVERTQSKVWVSIPHREAKNKELTNYLTKKSKFQSLIGRLKTHLSFCRMRLRLQFQSLIGRLKTVVDEIQIEDEDQFQSLIGRLKT